MSDLLRQIIARNRSGQPVAIPSVCTAHPEALEASLTLAETLDQPVVVEATSNQVNQDGGYTGLKPADFIRFVNDIAARAKVSPTRILFGGDHLGPQAWRKLPATQAMEKAHKMVADYAAAGFTKIHLDCSEGCAGEPAQLPDADHRHPLRSTCRNRARACPGPHKTPFRHRHRSPAPRRCAHRRPWRYPPDHPGVGRSHPCRPLPKPSVPRTCLSTRSAASSFNPASNSRRWRSTTSPSPATPASSQP